MPAVLGPAIPILGRLPPRRFLALFSIILFLVVLATISFLRSSLPGSTKDLSASIADHIPEYIPKPPVPKLGLPKLRSPFGPSVHEPPVQANSTSGESKWYTDWKWLNPFSSSITLDENRSVLPPLRKRTPVYTFYDTSTKKDGAVRAAENELLLIWRRAWWAQGFKPIVLGRAEAMNNPLYETLHTHQLDSGMELEVIRWLAWEHMQAGILVNWLALPMGSYNDPLISFLRRGEYRALTRYQGLGAGLLSADHSSATEFLKQALNNKELGKLKTIFDAVPAQSVEVDSAHGGIAFYDADTIAKLYKSLKDKIHSSEADGLMDLARLINSHLHSTFQNTFSEGIAVIKPDVEHAAVLVQSGLELAGALRQCADSSLPSSCPPNIPKCNPCDPSNLLKTSITSVYRNASDLYVVGTVPHPYTFASLSSQRDSLDVAYIRRRTNRDPWISGITKELLGEEIGASPRLIKFKEAVVGEGGSPRSLWLIPEKVEEPVHDFDWHFGFAIPKMTAKKVSPQPPIANEGGLKKGKQLLQKSKNAVQSSSRQQKTIVAMVEAWNLADTEAWRFARAYAARSRVERLIWQEEEKKFAGGVSKFD